jgi:biotin carboxyl carrier protein
MKRISVMVDGRATDGYAHFARGTLWVHLDGETYSVDTLKRSARGAERSRGDSADPTQIIAPMPGKIVKLMVSKGAKVAVGQVVVVMEAMKMEYTLKAHIEGEISDIRCDAGQQVNLGQVLVKLKGEAK